MDTTKEEPIADSDVGTEEPGAEEPKSPQQPKRELEVKERYPSFACFQPDKRERSKSQSPKRRERSLSPPKDTSIAEVTEELPTEHHRKRSSTPYREREESLSPTTRIKNALQLCSQEEVQPTEHWSRWSRFQYEKQQELQSRTETMAEGSRRSSRRSRSSIRRTSTEMSPLPGGSQQDRDVIEPARRSGFHRPRKGYASSPSCRAEIESKNEQIKRLRKWKQELEEIEQRLHRKSTAQMSHCSTIDSPDTKSIPQKRSSRKPSPLTTSVGKVISYVRGHSAPPPSSQHRLVSQATPEKRKPSGKSRTPSPSSHKPKGQGRQDSEVEEYYLRQLERLGCNVAKLMRIILDLNPQFSAEYIYNIASSREFDTAVELVEFVLNSLPADANLGSFSKRNLLPRDD